MVNFNGLNPIFAARISAAIADAEKATGGKAVVRSAYRTYGEQKALWNESTGNGRHAKSWAVASPGKSLHEQGMAFDLEAGPVRDWIEANASRYGLEPASSRHGWGYDPSHIQLARSVLKTPYDSTPNAYAEGGRKLPGVPVDPFGVVTAKESGSLPSAAARPAQTLRKGMSGEAVRQLQTALASHALYTGKIDGVYGPKTESAVRNAESMFGLPTRDKGVAGPQVLAALNPPSPAYASGGGVDSSPMSPYQPGQTTLPAAGSDAPLSFTPHSLGPYITGAPGRTGAEVPQPFSTAGLPRPPAAPNPGLPPPEGLSNLSAMTGGMGQMPPGAGAGSGPFLARPDHPSPNDTPLSLASIGKYIANIPASIYDATFGQNPAAATPSPTGTLYDKVPPAVPAPTPSPNDIAPFSYPPIPPTGPVDSLRLLSPGQIGAASSIGLKALAKTAPGLSNWTSPITDGGPPLGFSGSGSSDFLTGSSGSAMMVPPGSPVTPSQSASPLSMDMSMPSGPPQREASPIALSGSAGFSMPSGVGGFGERRNAFANGETNIDPMDMNGLPSRFSAPGYQPFPSGANPALYASAGNPHIPGPSVSPRPIGSPSVAPMSWPDSFGPGPAAAAITPAGGQPYMYGNNGAALGGPMAGVAPINFAPPLAYTPPPAVRPQAVKQAAVTALAKALTAGAGISAPGGSSGGYAPTQSYFGQSPGSYSFAGMSPWGSATYSMPGGGFSNSPFTPSGAGWQSPNFSPGSGGPTYAYKPDGNGGGTFVNSRGETMSY